MAVTLEIIPIPIGSAFVETLGTDDPESLNDFRVLRCSSLDALKMAQDSKRATSRFQRVRALWN